MELYALSSLEHWWWDQPSESFRKQISPSLTRRSDSLYLAPPTNCTTLQVAVPSVGEHKTGSLGSPKHPIPSHPPGCWCVGIIHQHARMVMIVMKMVKLNGHLGIPSLFPILLLISTATLLLPSSGGAAAAAASGFTVSGRHLLRNDDGVHFLYIYITTSTCIAYCSTPACCYSLDAWMPFWLQFLGSTLIGLKMRTSEDIRRWRNLYRFLLWSQSSSCNCRCTHFSCMNIGK